MLLHGHGGSRRRGYDPPRDAPASRPAGRPPVCPPPPPLPPDAAVAAAVLAVLLYAVTLAGTYAYDDLSIVRDDARVRSPARWGQLWTGDYFDGGSDRLYRPLVSTSYAVEWLLHGDRPWAFHLANVLLHAAVAAGVAELARRAAPRPSAAWPAGLLFAALPCHVEAVANVVGRAESAAAAGLVWSLVLLARRPPHRPPGGRRRRPRPRRPPEQGAGPARPAALGDVLVHARPPRKSRARRVLPE